MQTLARFATQKRWWVIAGWLLVIVATQLLSEAAGGATYKDVFTLPHTESQTVLDLLRANGQSGQTGQSGTVVVHAKTGTLDANQAPPSLESALVKLCSSGDHVAQITTPWTTISCAKPSTPAPGVALLLSKDRTTGLVNVEWQGNQNDVGNFTGVYDSLKHLSSSTTQYEFTGGGFENLAQRQKGIPPEALGALIALLILAIVFRTPGPVFLPLLSAAAALGTGLALISLLSHVMNVATFATQLSQLMVIGVGVDYALFIVTRHRRNLLRGMPVNESIAVAINTSGRAVLFAGLTVCVAILGLCALGVSFLYGVAIGTAIAVALTMIASLTLLPAVLSLLGYRALPRRVRKAVAAGTYVPQERPTRWAGWSTYVSQHKLALGTVAAGVIVVLAIPFFSMRLGHADASTDPTSTTGRRGYDLVAHSFGTGYNSVLELVVSGPTATEPAYLNSLAGQLRNVVDVDTTSVHAAPIGKDLAFVTFKSTTSPQDPKTTDLVKTLRSRIVPTMEKGSPNHIYVFGQTAILVDFAKVLSAKIPFFFVAIIGLSFLLLMLAFRSLLIPLTAAIMNLFAAAASFGVVVAIFQWGWFSSVLGIGGGGPIDAFLPVLFFAILFGLSMDYQVFLVSRMHEEWVHTGDNERAVRIGQTETGGIITAAAFIMIAVFGSFLLGNERTIKLVGIGLGGAVFLDAFILRTVLVPALMHQFGKANWYFPKWLDRITPRVSVEPDDGTWERATGEEPGDKRELTPV
jgi:RND superfamily putative drug exporter